MAEYVKRLISKDEQDTYYPQTIASAVMVGSGSSQVSVETALNNIKQVPTSGNDGQVLTKTPDGYAFLDAEGGVKIAVASGTTPPSGLKAGDFWYQVT